MQGNVHIINKQVFEFECLQSEHAFQIQQKADHVMQDKISKAIDRVCDQMTDGDETLQITLLEINLGKISFNQLEQDIAPAFEKAFFEKLSEWKKNNSLKSPALVSKQQSSFEIAKTFLLTGYLPWFAGKPGKNYIEELFAGLFSEQREELKNFILLNLANEKFIERLALQLDTTYLNYIINLLDINANLIFEIENEIKKSLLVNNNGEEDNIQLHKIAFEFTFKLISGKIEFSTEEQFYEQFKKMVAEKFELNPAIFNPSSLKEETHYDELLNAINHEKEKIKKNKSSLEQEERKDEGTGESAKFYISNAGLVLIANYFPAFLNELQLLEQGNFTGKQSQIKSVFLLHYLCTGEESAPEYTLPLNKILCGLPLNEPLPSFVLLNEKEKNECNELLNEIINNWQKLGNSSVEALWEAFLNRDGILSFETNGWKLQVERKGFDILLDSLPWNYKHIQFSWMENLITTEW